MLRFAPMVSDKALECRTRLRHLSLNSMRIVSIGVSPKFSILCTPAGTQETCPLRHVCSCRPAASSVTPKCWSFIATTTWLGGTRVFMELNEKPKPAKVVHEFIEVCTLSDLVLPPVRKEDPQRPRVVGQEKKPTPRPWTCRNRVKQVLQIGRAHV